MKGAALPVKVAVIDPVVRVLVLVRLALLVDRDQLDVRLFGGQHHMTDVPIAGVERLAKQRRNVFPHEGFTKGQIERVAYASQASIQLSLRAMLYGLAKNSSTRWRAYR